MIGIGYKIDQTKGLFFDRKKVQSSADRAKRRVLSNFGAFVRTRARDSIKPAPFATRKERGKDRTDFRRKSSEPGQPPFSQTGLLRKFIFFAYDPLDAGVLIGPAKLNRTRSNAPEILEEGGRIETGPHRGEFIEPRPYMGPAFDQELDDSMPDLWKNSIN